MFGGLLGGELTGDLSRDLGPLLEEVEAQAAAAAAAAAAQGQGPAGGEEGSGLDAMGRALEGMMGAGLRRAPGALSLRLAALLPGEPHRPPAKGWACLKERDTGAAAGEEVLGAGGQPGGQGSSLLSSLDDMEELLAGGGPGPGGPSLGGPGPGGPSGASRRPPPPPPQQQQQPPAPQREQQPQLQRPRWPQAAGDEERGGRMRVRRRDSCGLWAGQDLPRQTGAALACALTTCPTVLLCRATPQPGLP
jgi:hypothetical protein